MWKKIRTVSNCGLLIKDVKIKLTNKLCKIKFVILYDSSKGSDELNKMIKNNFGLF